MTYSGNNTNADVNSAVPMGLSASEVSSHVFPQPPEDWDPVEDADKFYYDKVAGKVWIWDGEKWVLEFNPGKTLKAVPGPQGKDGPEGPKGPKWEYDELTDAEKIAVKGPTGATGSGATGATGNMGATGIPGSTGPRGDAFCSDVAIAPNQDERGRLFIDKYNQIYVTLG